LKRFGDDIETSVDFQLSGPIRLLDGGDIASQDAAASGRLMTVSMSSFQLAVSMRKIGETAWSPVGQLNLRCERDYAPSVQKISYVARGAKFAVKSETRTTAQWSFASSYLPEDPAVDEAKLAGEMHRAAEASQPLEGVRPTSVADVMLNGVAMRMESLDWVNRHLVVQYQLPGILLVNDSDEPVTYEIRGPGSAWSEPRTLGPKHYDEFRVPHALTWRCRMASETLFYTLPLGREISYRTSPKPGMVLVNQDSPTREDDATQ
jgi:hypothetical protein